MTWDLWVDFHIVDNDGLTHASTRDARAGVDVRPGGYLVVGNEDADPAVAQVVSVDDAGVVLLRILPGPAEAHLTLLEPPTIPGALKHPATAEGPLTRYRAPAPAYGGRGTDGCIARAGNAAVMRATTLKASTGDELVRLVDYYAGLAEDQQRRDGLARGPVDYYLDPDEPPGRWWGSGCRTVGLTGSAKTLRRSLGQGPLACRQCSRSIPPIGA